MFRIIKSLKSGLIQTGKILNHIQKIFLSVFFWIVILTLIMAVIMKQRHQIPDKAALLLNPDGDIVEQLSFDPLNRIMNMEEGEVLLKDLIDAVRKAKDDKRIQAIVLRTGNMGAVGMSKLLDLKSVLEEFKKSGKKIIAAGDEYDQNGYFLAALADEIYLHPMGMVFLEGFSRFATFFKDGLDKLNVDVHVFRVGEYKSAVEPFTRNSMSEDARNANLEFLNDLWKIWLQECSASRGIKVEDLENYIEQFKDSVVQNRGDMAKIALDAKLVDRIVHRDEIRERLIKLVGEDKKTGTFKQIGFKNYLASIDKDPPVNTSKKNIVGVVVAKGEISDGTKPPGEIGGDSTAMLIRQARLDENVKAIVLRVDSPGGSATASEIIRRECERARIDGKKVIVSMGTLAASGGYWISTASDEIWASPATITGSIGVFGVAPTIDRTLSEFLGVHVDGVGTTSMAGIERVDRPFNPDLGKVLQGIIDRIYDDFITKVAESRNMEKEAVDVIARGRVWSGEDALRLGLVDKLGRLQDAIDSAASQAGLGKNYQVQYIRPKMTQKEKLMAAFSSKLQSIAGGKNIIKNYPNIFRAPLRDMNKNINSITKLSDPKGVYAYCPFIIEQ